MVIVEHCKNCNGTNIELDSVHVNVELIKSKYCDKCYNHHNDKQHFFFCSEDCFHVFLRKVVNGEERIKFE